ncbi:MAG: PEGA domain-containing protein [Blastocatellia bacterium]|nr:PEGA domain-containing protein [Blastocatellia bacterium]
MKCPRCQNEVDDWHYYCPSCHALVHEYKPGQGGARIGLIERAGSRVLQALLWIGVFGGLVLMARTIDWEKFLSLFRQGGTSQETRPPAGVRRDGNAGSRQKERPGNAAEAPASNEPGAPQRKESAESVRDLKQRIEELSPPEESPQSAPPRPTPTVKAESLSVAAPPGPPPDPRPELGIDRIEKRQDGGSGYLAIDSYTAARIYVDGQFSGTTPRTVKLIPGDHQIRLIADGYDDWTRRVRLKRSQQVGIKASMKKKGS